MALTAFVVWTLAGAAFGAHPLWHAASLNMSEAAAARDVATVAAMLERGDDPDVRHAIRPALLDSARGEFTPLEAGAIAGRLEVVHLLLTHGATVDPRRRNELTCEAMRRGYTDVADYLAGDAAGKERPQGVPGDSKERRQGVPEDSNERRQGVPEDRAGCR